MAKRKTGKKAGGAAVVEKESFEKRTKRTITRGTVGLFMFKFVIPFPSQSGWATGADRFWWEEVPAIAKYGAAEKWAKARAKALNAKRVVLVEDSY